MSHLTCDFFFLHQFRRFRKSIRNSVAKAGAPSQIKRPDPLHCEERCLTSRCYREHLRKQRGCNTAPVRTQSRRTLNPGEVHKAEGSNNWVRLHVCRECARHTNCACRRPVEGHGRLTPGSTALDRANVPISRGSPSTPRRGQKEENKQKRASREPTTRCAGEEVSDRCSRV